MGKTVIIPETCRVYLDIYIISLVRDNMIIFQYQEFHPQTHK